MSNKVRQDAPRTKADNYQSYFIVLSHDCERRSCYNREDRQWGKSLCERIGAFAEEVRFYSGKQLESAATQTRSAAPPVRQSIGAIHCARIWYIERGEIQSDTERRLWKKVGQRAEVGEKAALVSYHLLRLSAVIGGMSTDTPCNNIKAHPERHFGRGRQG